MVVKLFRAKLSFTSKGLFFLFIERIKLEVIISFEKKSNCMLSREDDDDDDDDRLSKCLYFKLYLSFLAQKPIS